MNKVSTNRLNNDNKKLMILFFVLFISLFISALIFYFIGQDSLIKISYESLKKYSFLRLFLEILKRNIVYFIVVIFLASFGFNHFIYLLFCIVSVMFGISIIYFTKIASVDRMYIVLNISDYILYYPFLFYFTHISNLVSKYIKKAKKVETKTHKLDIIVIGYLKMSTIFLLIVIAYSLIYSYYVHLLL